MTTSAPLNDVHHPADPGRIEVHVAELQQFFNEMDPAPFRERDLDPAAEEYILEASRELPTNVPLSLVVHCDSTCDPGDAETLRQAVHDYFQIRSLATQRKLQHTLRVSRVSLIIGLSVLIASVIVSDLILRVVTNPRLGGILRECLLIGGWVALWHPLNALLYDRWPLRAEMKLYDRLSAMVVRVVSPRPNASPSDAQVLAASGAN